MEKKNTKTFKYDQGIVNIHYDELPKEEDLKKAFSNFMRSVYEQKEKVTAATVTLKD